MWVDSLHIHSLRKVVVTSDGWPRSSTVAWLVRLEPRATPRTSQEINLPAKVILPNGRLWISLSMQAWAFWWDCCFLIPYVCGSISRKHSACCLLPGWVCGFVLHNLSSHTVVSGRPGMPVIKLVTTQNPFHRQTENPRSVSAPGLLCSLATALRRLCRQA